MSLVPRKTVRLSVQNHDRDVVGLTYVYPVISRRAGGVSLGINLNPNNACNWRCIYCQVPNLSRGAAPDTDIELLQSELRGVLDDIVHGDFFETQVPPDARRLSDVAFSGNGEPTSAKAFGQSVDAVVEVLTEFGVIGKLKIVVITNGSFVHRLSVQSALRRLAASNGEIWLKVDSATAAGIERINSVRWSPERAMKAVMTAAPLCATWLQTCMFALDGKAPEKGELNAYLDFVAALQQQRTPFKGVLLYGLARESYQPEAARLSALPAEWLDDFAARIRTLGVDVKVSP